MWGIGFAAAATLSGCSGPRMVAPADVASGSRVLAVQGRKNATGAFVNESFALGSWKVSNVDRDWKSKSSFSVAGYGASKTKTGYTYDLEATSKWSGSCAALKKEKGGGLGGFSVAVGESNLVCECKNGDKSASAQLSGPNAKKHDQGQITWGDSALQLSIVEEASGSNLTGEPAGYRADRGGKAAGAVELLHPGQVWLANDLDAASSEALSCVFAGLMLYVPPDN